MEKKSNNPENLKKYTYILRELVENSEQLNVNEVRALQKKSNLSEEDLYKLETLIDKKIAEASNYLEYGEWNSAMDSIEEANYKDPFNKEMLKLYYTILIEKSKILGQTSVDKKNIEIILKRIHQVDRFLYNKLIKENKVKKKFNYLFLLPLLLLLIPIFIFFPSKKQDISTVIPKESFNYSRIGIRDIPVIYSTPIRNRSIKIDIIESELNGTKENFFYSLKFLFSSDEENILDIKGTISWIDSKGEEIYNKAFSSGNEVEYFKNEGIPITCYLTSQRLSPDLKEVIIKINDVITTEGKDRTLLKDIPTFSNNSPSYKLKTVESSFQIVEGVTSNYLNLTIILKNTGSETFNFLKGNIEWADEYQRVKYFKEIIFISHEDVPIRANESRVINKIFELDNTITQSYRINITEEL